MTGYLHNLAVRGAAENAPSLRPRLPSVFEPNTYAIAPTDHAIHDVPASNQPADADRFFSQREEHSVVPAELNRKSTVRERSESSPGRKHQHIEGRQVTNESSAESLAPMRDPTDVAAHQRTNRKRIAAKLSSVNPSLATVLGTVQETQPETQPNDMKPARDRVHHVKLTVTPERTHPVLEELMEPVGAKERKPARAMVTTRVHDDWRSEKDIRPERSKPSRGLPEEWELSTPLHSATPSTSRDVDMRIANEGDSPKAPSASISAEPLANPPLVYEAGTASIHVPRFAETVSGNVPSPSPRPAPPLLQPVVNHALLVSPKAIETVQPRTVVQITIGRVEIKAVPATRSRPKAPGVAASVMSLDEYLNRQAVGGSG